MAPMSDNTRRVNHALALPNDVLGADATLAVDYAIQAEEAGWDGFFLADTLIYPAPADAYPVPGMESPWDTAGNWSPHEYRDFVDPFIALAGVATRTSRIRLGTYITPIARRQPWQVARDVATLDRLSNGRIMLGVGLGLGYDYEKFGTTWEPITLARQYDEALEIIDRLWQGERLTHYGEHFKIDDVALLPTPVQQPRVPILVAGYWPNRRPFQRGARWDGIMPLFAPGENGEIAPEADLRAMLSYYHSLTDDPGDVFIVIEYPGGEVVSPEYIDICRQFGVTWLFTHAGRRWEGAVEDQSYVAERIRRGPRR